MQAQHSPLFQETRAKPLDEHTLREAQSVGQDTTAQPAEKSKTKPRTFEFRPKFQELQNSINDEHGRKSDTWVSHSFLLALADNRLLRSATSVLLLCEPISNTRISAVGTGKSSSECNIRSTSGRLSNLVTALLLTRVKRCACIFHIPGCMSVSVKFATR
jgi:hypothetical protein